MCALACVCVFWGVRGGTVYTCVFVVRAWPWGSAPCRHGSSSLFHCHSRMVSALGWKQTNREQECNIQHRLSRTEWEEAAQREAILYFSPERRKYSPHSLMSVLLVYNANKPIRNSVRHVSIMDAVPSYISSILTVAKMSQACKHESSAYPFTRCKLNQHMAAKVYFVDFISQELSWSTHL